MLYMLMIYAHEADWAAASEAERAQVMREHDDLMHDLKRVNKYHSCGALEGTAAATTVRVRSGKTLVSDGPFAETKEQFGGYYIVDARNLDDAMAIAARIPTARTGAVEIRPIIDVNT